MDRRAPQTDTEILCDMANRWLDRHFPGHYVDEIRLRLENGRKVTIPVVCRTGAVELTMTPAPLPDDQQDAAEAAEPQRSKCERELLALFREQRHRMTLPEIIQALAEREIEWSDRTIQRYLKKLHDEGLVDHQPEKTPPGYGLVDD